MRKFEILLVEDEENLHDALKLNLEMEGYSVSSSYDGAHALKQIQSAHFDLIILDIIFIYQRLKLIYPLIATT